MTPLRQRMVEDMQLRGLSEKTQEAYVRAVRQLAGHYGKSPDCISEEELHQYFLIPRQRQAGFSHQHFQDRSVRHQILLPADAQASVADP